MKVTFKYSSAFVQGECCIETSDTDKELINLQIDENSEFPEKGLDEPSISRFIAHTDNVEIKYPLIDSVARSFYSSISISSALT
jgi:hypothetical protein